MVNVGREGVGDWRRGAATILFRVGHTPRALANAIGSDESAREAPTVVGNNLACVALWKVLQCNDRAVPKAARILSRAAPLTPFTVMVTIYSPPVTPPFERLRCPHFPTVTNARPTHLLHVRMLNNTIYICVCVPLPSGPSQWVKQSPAPQFT